MDGPPPLVVVVSSPAAMSFTPLSASSNAPSSKRLDLYGSFDAGIAASALAAVATGAAAASSSILRRRDALARASTLMETTGSGSGAFFWGVGAATSSLCCFAVCCSVCAIFARLAARARCSGFMVAAAGFAGGAGAASASALARLAARARCSAFIAAAGAATPPLPQAPPRDGPPSRDPIRDPGILVRDARARASSDAADVDAATVASDIVERSIRVSRARATASRGRRASTIMTPPSNRRTAKPRTPDPRPGRMERFDATDFSSRRLSFPPRFRRGSLFRLRALGSSWPKNTKSTHGEISAYPRCDVEGRLSREFKRCFLGETRHSWCRAARASWSKDPVKDRGASRRVSPTARRARWATGPGGKREATLDAPRGR